VRHNGRTAVGVILVLMTASVGVCRGAWDGWSRRKVIAADAGLVASICPLAENGFSRAAGIAEAVPGEFDSRRGWLGVNLRPIPASGFPEEGCVVASVLPGTPAATGGLKDGDRIRAVDFRRALGVKGLIRLLSAAPVGSSVNVCVDRKGQRTVLPVVVGDRSRAKPGLRVSRTFLLAGKQRVVRGPAPIRLDFETRGLVWERMAAERHGSGGVVVRDVRDGSAAETAGIRAGMILEAVDGMPFVGIREIFELLADPASDAGTLDCVVSVRWRGCRLLLAIGPSGP